MRFPNIFGNKSVTEDTVDEIKTEMNLEDNNDNKINEGGHDSVNAMATHSGILPSLCRNATNFLRNQNLSHKSRQRNNSTVANAFVNNSNNMNSNITNNLLDSNNNDQSLNHSMTNANTTSIVGAPHAILDINSNIVTKHRNSLEDSGSYSSDTPDRSDLDNDNDTTKRRSFHRSGSIPSVDVEDSGFSSSNCLSDDKDINTSFDYEDCQDGNNSSKCYSLKCLKHPFSLSPLTARERARTFSIDSTSSDTSDTNASETTVLSSSLPAPHFNNSTNKFNKRKPSVDSCLNISSSEQTHSSAVGVVKRRSFRNRSRKNSTKKTSCTDNNKNNATSDDLVSSINIDTAPQPQLINTVENKAGVDNNNDYNNNYSRKNLSSSLDSAIPFRFADLFQPSGLITLVACIVYTVLLFFLVGGLTLSLTVLKKFVNKSDLKDLRENMLESRRRREILTSEEDGGS